MQFASFSEFLAMGGYGFYVWLSYGACVVILAGLGWQSYARNQALKQAVVEREARQARIKKANQEDAV